jgi:hypothetical protein
MADILRIPRLNPIRTSKARKRKHPNSPPRGACRQEDATNLNLEGVAYERIAWNSGHGQK